MLFSEYLIRIAERTAARGVRQFAVNLLVSATDTVATVISLEQSPPGLLAATGDTVCSTVLHAVGEILARMGDSIARDPALDAFDVALTPFRRQFGENVLAIILDPGGFSFSYGTPDADGGGWQRMRRVELPITTAARAFEEALFEFLRDPTRAATAAELLAVAQPASAREDAPDAQPASAREDAPDAQPASAREDAPDAQPANAREDAPDAQPANAREDAPPATRPTSKRKPSEPNTPV